MTNNIYSSNKLFIGTKRIVNRIFEQNLDKSNQ